MKFKKGSDIKVGVIGYGGAFNMGKAHLDQMKKAGMTPVAVAEKDKSRLKIAEKEFPEIQTYESVTKMLQKSDVNLITIITPHDSHAPLALQCLRAGKSVVCEKPLAIKTSECDAMIAEAKKRKLVLSTYHNRHWDGCILQAVEKVAKEKVIGDIVRIEAHMGNYSEPGSWWRSSKKISGGITYDWGVHLLEYSLQLINDDLIEVSGFAKNGFWAKKSPFGADCIEDEGFIVARFKKGLWLTLTITGIDSYPKSNERGCLEITGTTGTYIMDLVGYKIVKVVNGETIVTTGKNPASEGDKYYQNVAEHMVRGTKLVITGEWARLPIHILDLGDRSAAAGKALKAKYSRGA
ncbi:MAG: Gfo/Idh/MocA family oxidoreductase [Victivallales bacterium]|nr:Gfo/Idh/MocA family oxidoreductase [Victivallales bacterium]